MRSEGIETLRAIVRRSRWILIALIVIGIVAMNAIRHSQGPLYQATARVILSPTDLASVVAGFSGYVDPDLVEETEQALAHSRQLIEAAAAEAPASLGSASEIGSKMNIVKSGSTISFSATSSDPVDAIDTATAVAEAYPEWRASVSSTAIEQAIAEVESQLRSEGGRDPELVEQLRKLKVLETLNSGNVLLAEPARGAAQIRPSPVRDFVLGALIGLFCALVVIALREVIDTRVRSESEIEEILNVPVLGRVESLPRSSGLVSVGRGRERYGDVYDLLAANIAQARPRAVIAVTSATAGEGKTTTAANLAAALARRADKVALVDLDRRRPTIAKLFRIPSEARGVETVLRNGAALSGVTWDVSLDGQSQTPRRDPGVEGLPVNGAVSSYGATLRVIPFNRNANTSDPLNPAALSDLVTKLRKAFDYVVIDTAPALSVPDVTELAQLVDLVTVVVRHGRVSSSSLSAFGRMHRSWPKTDTAAILVGAPRHADNYTYYAPA